LTGQSGTVGFSNVTIPKSAVPYGTTPVIYIDNLPAQNQSYTQDANNYYISYTTHFSTHQIFIVFTTPSTHSPTASPNQSSDQLSLIQTIYVVAAAVATTVMVAVVFKLIINGKQRAQPK
jgi:hypothetical protein